MTRQLLAASAALLGASLCAAPVFATVATSSFTAASPVSIDNQANVAIGTVAFTAGQFSVGESIADIVVQADWLKTDGTCAAPATGHAFHNETGFSVVSPQGTTVTLLAPNTTYYSGGAATPWLTSAWTSMSVGTSGATPVDGTFAPQNPTTALAGESPVGTWTLLGTDSTIADPLCVLAFEITVVGAGTNLTTTFASNNGQSGNMFDINALSALTVTGFDINIDPGTHTVELYTKVGTHSGFESDIGAWTLIHSGTVTGAGLDAATFFDLGTNAFAVAAGATRGIYLTATSGTPFNYTNGTAQGAVYASNGDLEITEGVGKQYPFGATFSPRVWNGTVYYNSAPGGGSTVAAPVADGSNGAPYGDDAFTNIELDGSLSTDSDGTIVQWEWACEGVENGWTEAPNNGIEDCVYAVADTYEAVLRVTDNFGLIGVYRVPVVVDLPGSAPSADAGGPYTANQGQSIALDGSGSVDADGDIVGYAWDCTDDGIYDRVGNTSPLGDVCVYPDIGNYTVRLRVTDSLGYTSEDTADVVITNTPPIGVSGGHYAGFEGLPVTVNGGGSGDVDGVIVQYEWDCNDDGTFELSAAIATATCSYPDNGVYNIALRVTDDDGDTNTVATYVTVDNVAPVITSVIYPTGALEASPATLSAAATDVPADVLTYTWAFGDGTTAVGSSVSKTWATSRNYTVVLTVTDDDGGSASISSVVTVGNVAPVIDSMTVPATGNEGQAISVTAVASDVGGDALIYTWAWGDGTTSNGATVQKTYADNGTYTVSLTVTDDDGGTTNSTRTVTIANLNPVITSATVPASANEGTTVLVNATGTDVAADTKTFTWSWGDGTSSVGASNSHIYADNGTFTVVLTLTDDDGGSATTTRTIVVANVAPVFANVAIPALGGEGQVISMSASAIDAPADVLTFVWDYGDGASDTFTVGPGPSASATSHSYDDEGVYTIVLTVSDDDGGVSVFGNSIITISNLDPVVSSLTVPDGDEGEELSFEVVATDAPGDPLTYQWNFGDGATAAGPTATHTFTDDGAFTVSVTIVDDGEGGTTTVSSVATIANVTPTITSLTAPAGGGEGEALLFELVADDAGASDIPDLLVTWDWGDGTTSTGMSVTHAWIDQGSWTVTMVLDDLDGGVVTQTMSVETVNVAPEITSTPPVNAVQGALYTYQVVVNEPGDDVLTFSLAPAAPAGMNMDTATGLIEFTPTYAQSQAGPYTVVIGVDDGEGGVDGQVYSLNVLAADTDGDGIADDWESLYGLDPLDPADGNVDLDLDGLTNVQEFGLDQNPNVFDGPSAPVGFWPIAGDEVDTDNPDLILDNAVDPNGDVLVYEYRVYSDASMVTLVTSQTGVAESGSGQTLWKIQVPLAENTDYWWRARARDPYVAGPWSSLQRFFVNVENEEPSAVTAVWPIDEENTGSLTPALAWTVASDVDRDEVFYDVEVYDVSGELLITSAVDVASAGGATATWTVDVSLEEDTVYSWRVLPVDEHGLAADWTELERFFADGTNEAPTGTVFVSPDDGVSMADQSPPLVATEGTDPEGGALTYQFEVDATSTFDSTNYRTAMVPATGTGTVTWSLVAAGVTLRPNQTNYARVRAVDQGGVSSAPDTISFFVRGDNDAPNIPVLLAPEDGVASDDTTPRFTVESPIDPEGDTAFVEFAYARDIDMNNVVGGNASVLVTAGETGWVVETPFRGRVYWSARSFDIEGAYSDWAEPFLYVGPPVEDVGGDDPTDPGVDCSDCSGSLSGPAAAPAWALMLALGPLILVRRRR